MLDYFQSPMQQSLTKIFTWENNFVLRPGRNMIQFLRNVCRDIAASIPGNIALKMITLGVCTVCVLKSLVSLFRVVQFADGTYALSGAYTLMIDQTPEQSILLKNFPELKALRDVAFYWKYFLNPDITAFPNYIEPKAKSHSSKRLTRMQAILNFQWDANAGGYQVSALGRVLTCRPDPNKPDPVTGKPVPADQLPKHRYPSTATPSFYVNPPAIHTEDDVIYRPNLPGFEDSRAQGQVLGQRDSELLISFLTVPYIRLPLVLTFFASDDRVHKLQSKKLRGLLDSLLFEPGKYLSVEMTGVEPVMVPTLHPDLLATPYGLLLNELHRSPTNVLNAASLLLEGVLALDTGSVCDPEPPTVQIGLGAAKDDGKLKVTDFNTSTDIILYAVRLGVAHCSHCSHMLFNCCCVGARFDNYITFLLEHATGQHQCIDTKLREVEVTDDCIDALREGGARLRSQLLDQFVPLLEDYTNRLHQQCKDDPANEKLIDRNSRLACDLHAHRLLMFRNVPLSTRVASAISGSFVFLTTRHTWNKVRFHSISSSTVTFLTLLQS